MIPCHSPGELVLVVAAGGVRVHRRAPEGLRGNVARHLTDFPAAGQGREHRVGQHAPGTLTPVLLQNEELVHPPAVRSDSNPPVHERKAGIAVGGKRYEGKAAFCLPVPIEVVAVLAVAVEVLVPDVGQVVLVELQHALERQPIGRRCAAHAEGARRHRERTITSARTPRGSPLPAPRRHPSAPGSVWPSRAARSGPSSASRS